MLADNILFTLVKNMGVIVTFAYILSKNANFTQIIERRNRYWKLFLALFCIPLSIAGTYLSIEILDALANIRSLGAIVGGIYGGPLVGMGIGIVSGLHRWSLGGFTAFACAVGVVTSGCLGGIYYRQRREKNPTTPGAICITGVALLIEMVIVVVLSWPKDQAVSLVQIITIPMTMSNMLGVGIFVNIIENAREENDHIRALQSRLALNIANQTLPFLRNGLDRSSATKVVEIIYRESGVDAVAIANHQEILAFVGEGADHHCVGHEVLTDATRKTLYDGETRILRCKSEIGCKHPKCPLRSAVLEPLYNREKVVGVLKLYRSGWKEISPADVELARGISSLLSSQMEIARLTEQAQLAVQAELKALQTQINPHFLFNAINTIVSYCRTKPMIARELLLKLSEVFRYTLQGQGYLSALEEELQVVKDYMAIEQARFGERIQLDIHVPEHLLKTAIPRFSLQPLVENAVRHGVSKKPGPGNILIQATEVEHGVQFQVKDNGIGIPADRMNYILRSGEGENMGIGLSNVHQRLVNLFGPSAGIRIESQTGEGTCMTFTVPVKE